MDQSQIKWDSNDYRSNSSAQLSWAMDMISRIGVKEDSTVLDIGCGDGRVTRELARIACDGKAVGIDASANMIALARNSFPGVSNLSFIQIDARKMDLPGKFNIAFSNATLHWIKEQDEFLSSLHRHMLPGGTLHFSFGGKGNAQAIFDVANQLAKRPEWAQYFPPDVIGPKNLPYVFLGDDEYRELLERNGFTPDEVRLVPKDMAQDGRLGLTGWMRTTWMPVTSRVPESMREKLLSEIVDEYLKEHPLVSGKAIVKMVRLEAHARVA